MKKESITIAQLIEFIKNESLQENLFDEYNKKYLTHEQIKFLGTYEIVDSVCNSDEMYVVIKFKDHKCFIRIEGEYDSYGGGEHFYQGEITQVIPKQKTITIYESLKP